MSVQNYQHLVYRPEVLLGVVSISLNRLRPESNCFQVNVLVLTAIGYKHSALTKFLVDVSDIFYFFCSGGEREEVSEEVAGGPVLLKNRGRGGVMGGGGGGGEGRQGGGCVWGGGGAKYFFRGRDAHQELGFLRGELFQDRLYFFKENAPEASRMALYASKLTGCTPRGSCNNTLLRRVLRRFFKGSAS